ncbi:hypothetical protein MKA35_20480 [[Clostridium] innocuum]|jgi:hypothetical protein|nr:hypothetical protein [[Clostridium] innocuum]MCR0487171.1 hypothetical protein [[Clostridium] innocuum]
MKWEEVKNLIERSVPEQLLNDYLIAIEIANANTTCIETRIEIDNSKCVIIIAES